MILHSFRLRGVLRESETNLVPAMPDYAVPRYPGIVSGRPDATTLGHSRIHCRFGVRSSEHMAFDWREQLTKGDELGGTWLRPPDLNTTMMPFHNPTRRSPSAGANAALSRLSPQGLGAYSRATDVRQSR
jgi:hypothetical protein